MSNWAYSHVYVERDAFQYADTNAILRRIDSPSIVEIERYGEIFHRPRQRFQMQKMSQKLILAVDHGKLIYKSDERIESFGEGRIYYNAPIRNCVYNCDYCFLQGMHSSANILIFVNHNDFISAAARQAQINGSLYLSISYLTDLLAFEGLIPFCRRWIEFVSDNQNVTIEIRTKSDNFRAISSMKPLPNVILVWSLTPSKLAQRYESGAASFHNRVIDIVAAIQSGWRVRLCFDPILLTEGWEEYYASCFRQLARRVEIDRVEKISFGLFRMHPDFLKRMRRDHPAPGIVWHPFIKQGDAIGYDPSIVEDAKRVICNELSRYISSDKLIFANG